ncbi:MAG: NTP transferase domain-containing protein [Oscillospiraceae bacterium]|nr:NTP transferase domain-containing protein [Oscillospiraceae bacterium]
MKAIIMAGGFGTRLMPLTAEKPKPMIKIIDRPVIRYTLELLKKHGISDVCVTLGYLPDVIRDYLTENDGFGLNVSFVTEDTPMGTAGSVGMCREFLGSDGFIVISGDAVCDFDLTACVHRHRELGSKASILLYSHPEPLEYGLVLMGSGSRITGFAEKPSWDGVKTNLVNTGIYIFSNEILCHIPENEPCDFGRDVFPALLGENYPLYGIEAGGCWCDIGSPESCRKCTGDILSGKARLSLPAPAPGRDDITATHPSYISPDADVAPGAVIGGHSVIGGGCVVGRNAVIRESVIGGAEIGENCNIDGSIISSGCQIRPGVKIGEGCVIAENTVIGDHAVLMPGVSVWPGQRIMPGETVGRSIVSDTLRGFPGFTAPGKMAGKYCYALTPEKCFDLGAACAVFGRVGANSSQTPGADTLAASFSCGVSSAGGIPVASDIDFPEGSACLGRLTGAAVTAFFAEKDGDVTVYFTDRYGLPISRETERKLESAFSSGTNPAPPESAYAPITVTGGTELYKAAAMGNLMTDTDISRLRVSVAGDVPECSVLREILASLGCGHNSGGFGVPVFELRDGYLRVRDERGKTADPRQIMCILIKSEIEHGSGRAAVPFDAPQAIDEAAGPVLRIGRDEGAEELYRNEPWLWDGIFASLRLISVMADTGKSIGQLADELPDFAVTSREVAIKGKRSDAMRALSDTGSFESDSGPGLAYNGETGFARVRAMPNREALRIDAECATMEDAEELCLKIRDMIENTSG